MSSKPNPNRRRSWLQFNLRSLFVLTTVVAALTLPGWYCYHNWWRFQYTSDPDITRERIRVWLETNPHTAAEWQLPGVAGQTQESDLPGTP